MQLKLSELNTQDIALGKYTEQLPELYKLKNVVENNPWHNQDVTFDHTINVVDNLSKVINEQDQKIKDYLSQKLDSYSREKILFLSAVFHDIAKPEVIQEKGEENMFPEHELKGSKKAESIISRFDLSPAEQELTLKTIKYHGVLHGALNNKREQHRSLVNDFKNNYPDIFIEIIILSMADMLGAHLKENNPEEFSYRYNFYQQLLDKY